MFDVTKSLRLGASLLNVAGPKLTFRSSSETFPSEMRSGFHMKILDGRGAISGEVDYRTPMSESEQYYQALKLRGVDTALVRIPEASHGIAARPSHLISKVAHILAWFERHDVEAAD